LAHVGDAGADRDIRWGVGSDGGDGASTLAAKDVWIARRWVDTGTEVADRSCQLKMTVC